MAAKRATRAKEPSGFPTWGALAVPAGLLWGTLLGVVVGAFFGNAGIGAAVGAGLGVGVGISLLAAAIVIASAEV